MAYCVNKGTAKRVRPRRGRKEQKPRMGSDTEEFDEKNEQVKEARGTNAEGI